MELAQWHRCLRHYIRRGPNAEATWTGALFLTALQILDGFYAPKSDFT